jgi:hypothetical protein
MTLLGEIVDKDGMICLQTAPGVFYPLDGNSGIAEDFRETFHKPRRSDIGRQLHRQGGVLWIESIEQRDLRKGMTESPTWDGRSSTLANEQHPGRYRK